MSQPPVDRHSPNLGISVIVCTYNRPALLAECLRALANQTLDQSQYEVIVVNNYVPQSLTTVIAQNYPIDNIRLINEPQSGLSYARNTGYESAKFPWIAYIDDDALADESWLLIAHDIFSEDQFDCFGGVYRPWWKYPRPRWLSPVYGSKPPLSQSRAIILVGYNWGSNIFFKKNALIKVGGFPEHLGMRADTIGYAEETYVQQKLRQQGKQIGFDPDLIVHHLVGQHKLTMRWHIMAAYADARDQMVSLPEQYQWSVLLDDFRQIFTSPIKATAKWISRSEYYWEHVWIDSTKPIFLFFGKLSALMKASNLDK